MRLCQIQHNLMYSKERFMQTRQRIFKIAFSCKFYYFLDKILKLFTYHMPFSH